MWSCFFVDVCVEDMKGEKMHLKMRLGNFCDMSQVRTHTTMMAMNGCLGINFPPDVTVEEEKQRREQRLFHIAISGILIDICTNGIDG